MVYLFILLINISVVKQIKKQDIDLFLFKKIPFFFKDEPRMFFIKYAFGVNIFTVNIDVMRNL